MKLLGEGSYGCVYLGTPINDINDNVKLVKLMVDQEDFQKEIKNMGLIRNIPNYEEHNIVSEKMIITNITEQLIQDSKYLEYIQLCKNVKDKKKIYQIIYNKDLEGETIKNLLEQKKITIDDIYKLSLNLYIGLLDYISLEILHNDIKSNNIIYIKSKNKLFFIDFGLLSTFNNTLIEKCNVIKDFLIFTAPEYILYNYGSCKKTKEEFIFNFLKKLNTIKIFYNFIKYIYPEEEQKKDLNDLYDNYYKKNFIFSNDDKALLDLYSLSMTLLYILYNNKEQIINEIYIKNFIVDILKPSIIFNNSKRITITQIIQKIKDLNKKYNIILSDL